MEFTIPPNMIKEQENIVNGAITIMKVGQYVAATPAQFPTMSPTSLFIRNAIPALAPISKILYVNGFQMNVFVFVALGEDVLRPTPRQWLAKKKKWADIEYRHLYMNAAIEQGVAWQIKNNRERRHLSQKALANCISTKQSAISRAEDPSYGRHNLETLVKIANAFDCALQVRFVPYSQLAEDSDDLSPDALYAKSYSEEINS
ncbi:MAG: helix-turn-helix transcriptional regulator [Candidatus Nitrotoga sp.]|nr:helix-turn-helix transcriptional regulator [Candidatus Nitrotoga sp.]